MSLDGSARSDAPAPKAWINRISPYVAGEGGSSDARSVIKLSANENPRGPSPAATDAYRRAADRLAVYPDSGATALREAISSVHGVDPANLICGAGSDELIAFLCQAFAGPGDEVIHTEHGFAMYRISALAAGADPISVAETDLTADPSAILAAVTPRTRLVFIANPNNPTGTYLDAETVRKLAEALPPHVLLVLDGAYAEYMRSRDYDAGLALAGRLPNVVMLRTFSKIHGLAALRIGWAFASSAVIDALHRVRGPFNASAPALAAAEAAMRDVEYVENCALQNEVWRDWTAKQLRLLGLETPESFGNFVLSRFGAQGPCSAASADSYLRAKGVFVRRMDSYGLPEHLRISIGASSDLTYLVACLTEFMDGAARSSSSAAE